VGEVLWPVGVAHGQMYHPDLVAVIAVTGSASGIGAALAARLTSGGHEVIGIDLAGADVVADLSDAAGRQVAVDGVLERCQGRLDGLAACAGVGPTAPQRLIAAVNAFGAVAVLDGLRPALADGGGAAVVVSSSSVRLVPDPGTGLRDALVADDEAAALELAERHDGSTVYAMSKAALALAVRQRADAWGTAGVRLNAVAPGPVETPLLDASLADPVLGPLVDALPVPLGRRAAADEIAAVLEFLLSPGASYVHGALWWVDGGTDATTSPTML
jgi:NAD(P)-dependent dehydrogenase (short-subunit alcohol dehydrogenase family)